MTEHCFNVRDVGFAPGNIHPMLTQCEPIVSDTGQHCTNIGLVFAGLYHITAVKKCYVERAVPPLLGVRCQRQWPSIKLNMCLPGFIC